MSKKITHNIDLGSDLDLDLDLQTRKKDHKKPIPTPPVNIEIYANGFIGILGSGTYQQPFTIQATNQDLKKIDNTTRISLSTHSGIFLQSFSDDDNKTILESIEATKNEKGDNTLTLKLLQEPNTPVFPNSKIEVKKFGSYFWSGIVEEVPIKENLKLYELKAVGYYNRIKNLKITPIKYNITNISNTSSGYKISYNLDISKYNQLIINAGFKIILRGLRETEDNGIKTVKIRSSIGAGFIYINENLLKSVGNQIKASIEFIPSIFNCLENPKPLLFDIFVEFCKLYLNELGLDFIQLNTSKIVDESYFIRNYKKNSNSILDSLRLNKPFAVNDITVGDFVKKVEELSGNRLRIFVSGSSEWQMIDTFSFRDTFIEDEGFYELSVKEETKSLYNEVSIRGKIFTDSSNVKGITLVKRDKSSIMLYGKKTYRETLDNPTHLNTLELYANNFLNAYKVPNEKIKVKKIKPTQNLNPVCYNIITDRYYRNIQAKVTKITEKNEINKTTYFDYLISNLSYYQVPNEYRIDVNSLNYEVEFDLIRDDDKQFFTNSYNNLTFFFKNDKYQGNIFNIDIIGDKNSIKSVIQSYSVEKYELVYISLKSFSDSLLRKIKLKPLKTNFQGKISSFFINGLFSKTYKTSLNSLVYEYKAGIENYKIDFSNTVSNSRTIIDSLKSKLNFKGYEI